MAPGSRRRFRRLAMTASCTVQRFFLAHEDRLPLLVTPTLHGCLRLSRPARAAAGALDRKHAVPAHLPQDHSDHVAADAGALGFDLGDREGRKLALDDAS